MMLILYKTTIDGKPIELEVEFEAEYGDWGVDDWHQYRFEISITSAVDRDGIDRYPELTSAELDDLLAKCEDVAEASRRDYDEMREEFATF